MAETYDPAKLTVATRLIRDEDENGVIIDENTKEWKSGVLEISIFNKQGLFIASKQLNVTRNKYVALREDLDQYSTKEVAKEYFPDLKLTTASKDDYQVEADHSATETAKREDEVKKTEAEDEKVRFLSAEPVYTTDEKGKPVVEDGNKVVAADSPSDYQNVRPVGDPDVTPSNPEQKLSAEEVIAKGGSSVGSDVPNPEQSAPNVPEDEFKTKGGNDNSDPVTNDVERNVTPAGADAKTNKEVAEVKKKDAKASK